MAAAASRCSGSRSAAEAASRPPGARDARRQPARPRPPAVERRRRSTGAGATFPNPIYTKWFDAYAKETGVRINYQSIGSGGGIRQFTEGTVDFGATDGPMTDEQIAAVKGNVLHVPTVLGAVVVTYNLPELGRDAAQASTAPPSPTSSSAGSPSGTTRASPRSIRGSKLPEKDIIVVHRSDGSGTTFIFTDYLSKVSPDVEGEGRKRHVGQLADRARRQGQRGRDPAGQAVRRRHRLRRADLRRSPTSCPMPR